jgi:uncharacterized membrane protein YcaP (DUF421 family)
MNHKLWTDMFSLGLPLAEKIVRPIVVYFFLVIVLRLAGKRELAQLNPFDLVVLISLSNTVQNAIIGDDNSVTGGLIGAASLIGVNFLTVRFLYKHPKLEELAEGKAALLIEDGAINHDRLKEELISMNELEIAAHRQGLGSLEEVQQATLEPGGAICFVPKKPTPELSRHQELLARLDQLAKAVEQLKGGQQPA